MTFAGGSMIELKRASRIRFWVAVAIAPLSGPLFFWLSIGFYKREELERGMSSMFSASYFIEQFPLILFGYLGMLFLGLPYALVLRRANKLSHFYLLAGSIFLAPIFLLFVFLLETGEWQLSWPWLSAFYTSWWGAITVFMAVGIGLITGVIAGIPLYGSNKATSPETKTEED